MIHYVISPTPFTFLIFVPAHPLLTVLFLFDPHNNRRPWLAICVICRLGTLDSSTVLQWLSKDTTVSHQVYKRIWPTTQREALFWSTIRHCPSDDDEGPDYWIVANHSSEHPDAPVRIQLSLISLQ